MCPERIPGDMQSFPGDTLRTPVVCISWRHSRTQILQDSLELSHSVQVVKAVFYF